MEKGKSGETIEDVTADNLSRHKPTYSASDINHASPNQPPTRAIN
ncbi:MAG TPA: hypothetical protein VH500_04595 [Nitrososphaeraceae archaeon]|jgi:hypothetical protein